MKIRPVEAELFDTDGPKDGQTDKAELTVVFRNYVNASNKGKSVLSPHYFCHLLPTRRIVMKYEYDTAAAHFPSIGSTENTLCFIQPPFNALMYLREAPIVT
jgi:hypothetical protein